MNNQVKTKQTNNRIMVIVFIGMLTALAFVLQMVEFPLLPSNYLKMDFSDIPAIVAGCAFGVVPGILVEAIKCILHVLVKGAGTTMGYGDIMNFLVGISFVIPFSLLTKKTNGSLKKGSKYILSYIIACIVAEIAMLITGFGGNYLLAPPYFKFVLHQTLGVKGALSAAILATSFNVLKGIILSVCSIILIPKIIIPLKNITNRS